ncbi:MAG: NUDIX domain-containing protein, partial [Bacteroidota bacterium]
MEAQEYVEQGKHLFIPQLSIDTVVIGFRDNQLKVLLLEFDGQWMLPGGHVYHHESVEEASHRILLERTGLAKYYLKLFHVFGDSDRSFPREMRQIFEKIGMRWKEDIWINDRYVSVGYYALVDIEQA